jgi:hypothetical protein
LAGISLPRQKACTEAAPIAERGLASGSPQSLQSPPLTVELGDRRLGTPLLALPPLDAIGEVLQLRRRAFLDGRRGLGRVFGPLELAFQPPGLDDVLDHAALDEGVRAAAVVRLVLISSTSALRKACAIGVSALRDYYFAR